MSRPHWAMRQIIALGVARILIRSIHVQLVTALQIE
jgi:hypothetical protein